MSWLADLGRSSYVSQRGLADTLKKLQEAGKLDANAATSRGSIKRARDTELQNMTTRFGPLLQQVSLQGSSSKKYAVSMINPVALWTHIVENSSGMDTLLSQAFRENPPSIGQKWSLVLYCDELVLGNALRHQNNRKLQVFYWSWLQLGSRALASEKCWFPVAVIRSTKVDELGGVTVVWPQILDP